MTGIFVAEVLLDGVEAVDEFLAGEGDRLARLAGAGRAADAVHVGLGVLGHVVVDDEREGLDVEAARGDVRGDEELDLARP